MKKPQLNNIAETYENYFVPAMFHPWASILLLHANLQPRESVIDLACGTGIVARLAAPLVGNEGKVVALDMNSKMLEVAQSLPAPSGATILWEKGNIVATPFQDSAFDVVLCQHALPFIEDRPSSINEMLRILKPGGRALVMVLQSLHQHPVFEALMGSVSRHLSIPISSVMTPFALSDINELRKLFSAVGFEEIEILSVSITARFSEPNRFVALAVKSSAAAVPAFSQLDEPAQSALLEAVRLEIEPTIQKYRNADSITFPMFAFIAVATK